MQYATLLDLKRELKTDVRLSIDSSGDTRKGHTYYVILKDAETGDTHVVRSRLELGELRRRLGIERQGSIHETSRG